MFNHTTHSLSMQKVKKISFQYQIKALHKGRLWVTLLVRTEETQSVGGSGNNSWSLQGGHRETWGQFLDTHDLFAKCFFRPRGRAQSAAHAAAAWLRRRVADSESGQPRPKGHSQTVDGLCFRKQYHHQTQSRQTVLNTIQLDKWKLSHLPPALKTLFANSSIHSFANSRSHFNLPN